MLNYDQLVSRLNPASNAPTVPPLSFVGQIGEGINEAFGKESALKAKIRAAAAAHEEKRMQEEAEMAKQNALLRGQFKNDNALQGDRLKAAASEGEKARANALAIAKLSASRGGSSVNMRAISDLLGEDFKATADWKKQSDDAFTGLWGKSEYAMGTTAKGGSSQKVFSGPEALANEAAMVIKDKQDQALSVLQHTPGMTVAEAREMRDNAVYEKMGHGNIAAGKALIDSLSYSVPTLPGKYASGAKGLTQRTRHAGEGIYTWFSGGKSYAPADVKGTPQITNVGKQMDQFDGIATDIPYGRDGRHQRVRILMSSSGPVDAGDNLGDVNTENSEGNNDPSPEESYQTLIDAQYTPEKASSLSGYAPTGK